jgi:hypothetical protein
VRSDDCRIIGAKRLPQWWNAFFDALTKNSGVSRRIFAPAAIGFEIVPPRRAYPSGEPIRF